MIQDDILKIVESNLADKNECSRIKNWFMRNEPRLIEWSVKIAHQQINSLGINIPQPVYETLEASFMISVLAGAMCSMMHDARVIGNEIDISEFKTIFNNNPGEIWSSWISGTLPDQYYDSEFVSRSVNLDNLGHYWIKAVSNHNMKLKGNGEGKAVSDMIGLVEKEVGTKDTVKKKKVSVDI